MTEKILLIVGVLLALVACTPPTPPPSPTPRPSPTAAVAEQTPAVQVQGAATRAPGVSPRPTVVASASATPTRSPLLPTDTPSVTAITLWVDLPEPQLEQLASDIETFQAEFPQYMVSLNAYNGPENFMPALSAGALGFDLVLASPVLLSNLQQADRLAPISDFFPPTFLDNFAAVTLMGATQNDEVWGLPQTAGFHLLLFYNKDLVDTPPATTEELRTLAASLTTDSQWGLGLNSYDPLWLVPWLQPYGGWLTGPEGQPTLDTAAMAEALALHLSWHDPDSAIAPVATYEEIWQQFLSGKVAMIISGDWAIGELAAVRDLNWGVARLPDVVQAEESQPAAPLVLAKYWAINQNVSGDQALAASAFLEFITRPERQLAWTAKFWTLPTRRAALNDPLIVNDSLRRISAAQMQAGRAVPLGLNINGLLDAMREPLRQVIDGQLAPAEAPPVMAANLEP